MATIRKIERWKVSRGELTIEADSYEAMREAVKEIGRKAWIAAGEPLDTVWPKATAREDLWKELIGDPPRREIELPDETSIIVEAIPEEAPAREVKIAVGDAAAVMADYVARSRHRLAADVLEEREIRTRLRFTKRDAARIREQLVEAYRRAEAEVLVR